MTEERKNGETTVVRFEGALTIQRAGELRAALLETGERSGCLAVEFEGFQEADLSFLQLVCAAHFEAVRSGWSLRWGREVPEAFLKTAEEYGFGRTRGCSRDKDHSCMWAALQERRTYGDNDSGDCAASGSAGRVL